MNATIYEISGVPYTSYSPRARLPKSLIATNWPVRKTRKHLQQRDRNLPSNEQPETTGRNQRVVYSAWDDTILTSPDTTQALSLRQTYHIAFLLRQLLIPDLIPPILRHAGIATRSSYAKKHDLAIPRSQSPYLYLITPPINSSVRLKCPVIEVVFTIVARDQGLDLNIGQSHFTAGVVRQATSDRGEDCDQADAFAGGEVVGERVVVKNTSAGDVYETHVVRWSCESRDAGEADWVKELREGDRIAVRAWAQWASFENRISSVEVEIFTTAVK